MNMLQLCMKIDTFLALPSTILFVVVGFIFTLRSRFIQIRTLPRLVSLLTKGVKHHHGKKEKMINPFHALLTAMSTTIGMGSITVPSIAVAAGGPGALFWLVVYAFFGAVTKFVEVMFALKLRKKLPDGSVLGGPSQYLRSISPWLGVWYAAITMFLFAGWSGLQANTLAKVFALESVPEWITGIILAVVVFFVLLGGVKRIGEVASKLVPFMFVLYVSFSSWIIFSDLKVLRYTLGLIFTHAFSPCAALGGFLGASVFAALKAGVHNSIYITEAGLGTSSIPHAMADTDSPRDQAILAMFSVVADMMLSFLSGLLVIVTGIWSRGGISSTLVYEVFKDFSGDIGKWVLLVSITLFVLTTVIGNSFNASQSFASFTRYRWMRWYYGALGVVIFTGALVSVPLIWKLMEVMLVFVAIPHLLGLLVLHIKYPEWLK